MTKLSIEESGVMFGDFEPDDLFYIEKSLKQYCYDEKGIKSVEFILRQGQNGKSIVSLVEAKSSIPREAEPFFSDIRLKMQHALIVWFCAVTGRHSELARELPSHLSGVKILRLPLRLILVIPELPDSFLPQMNDTFRKVLSVDCQLWGVANSAVLVLNKSRARKYGLIQ